MSIGNSAAIDEFRVSDHLTVHCFNRDGRESGVGRGPLFIVREWDLKVIRSIGHKPKCKGPNTEQALRACVRQGVLSMSLKTENATKEEIQTLKAVGVLGKRAPSGSLIGAADLVRLLEYFSKHDTANAFRQAIARKHAEGYICEEVFNSVNAIKERDIVHRFKVNTEAMEEEQPSTNQSMKSDQERLSSEPHQRRESSSSQSSSRKSSKRKRRHSSDSDSDSSRSSHSSDDRRRRSRRSSSSSRSKSSKRRDSKTSRASLQPLPTTYELQMIPHPPHSSDPNQPNNQSNNPYPYPTTMYPPSGYIIAPSVNIHGTPYTIFAHPPGTTQFSSLPLNVQQQFYSLPPNTTFTMYPASQSPPHTINQQTSINQSTPASSLSTQQQQQQQQQHPAGPLDALLTAVEYKTEMRDGNGQPINQSTNQSHHPGRTQVAMGKGMDSPPFLVAPTYTYQTHIPPNQQPHNSHQSINHQSINHQSNNHNHHAPKHTSIKKESTNQSINQTHGMMSPSSHPAIVRPLARLSPANSYTNLTALVNQSISQSPISRNMSSNSLIGGLGLPNSHSLLSLSSLTNGQYSHMFPSMSMTNLRDAAGSDEDDGDAGINGILHFEDEEPGNGNHMHRIPSIDQMHRIPSIESFGSMPRVPSNLSMLTNSMFSVGESRPQSPHHSTTRHQTINQPMHNHQRNDSLTSPSPPQSTNQSTNQSTVPLSTGGSTTSSSSPPVSATTAA